MDLEKWFDPMVFFSLPPDKELGRVRDFLVDPEQVELQARLL